MVCRNWLGESLRASCASCASIRSENAGAPQSTLGAFQLFRVYRRYGTTVGPKTYSQRGPTASAASGSLLQLWESMADSEPSVCSTIDPLHASRHAKSASQQIFEQLRNKNDTGAWEQSQKEALERARRQLEAEKRRMAQMVDSLGSCSSWPRQSNALIDWRQLYPSRRCRERTDFWHSSHTPRLPTKCLRASPFHRTRPTSNAP